MGVPPFERRVKCAEMLLKGREAAALRGWSLAEWAARKARFLAPVDDRQDETTVEGLLLVGREWLRSLNHPEIAALERAVYGDDTFEPLEFSETCQSGRLWGYDCPFGTAVYATDHLFPRSLGGLTDSRNRLTLCQWHNVAKSMDVHVFPWEEGVPGWVVPTIRKLASWIEHS